MGRSPPMEDFVAMYAKCCDCCGRAMWHQPKTSYFYSICTCLCDTYVHRMPLSSLSKDALGRAQLKGLLRLCDALDSEDDVLAAAYWLQVRT